MRIGEIEKLEGRDIAFDEIDGRPCVTAHIRESKTDQCRLGVHGTLVATGCSFCPVMGIAQWMDVEMWHPLASTGICGPRVAKTINVFLKGLAADCGMDPERVSSRSMRDGRATTLYANGIDPMDIQRWGRWKSPVYMRYVRRENVRWRTLSYDLAKQTDLSTHLSAPEQKTKSIARHAL